MDYLIGTGLGIVICICLQLFNIVSKRRDTRLDRQLAENLFDGCARKE